MNGYLLTPRFSFAIKGLEEFIYQRNEWSRDYLYQAEFTLNIQFAKWPLVFYFISRWVSLCYDFWNITILEFWKAEENGKTTGPLTVNRLGLTLFCLSHLFKVCSRRNCIVSWMFKGVCSPWIGIRACYRQVWVP